MQYRIIERDGQHLVENAETGSIESAHASRDEAVARIQALGGADNARKVVEREQRASDPGVQKQRRQKAAYQEVARDPILSALKHVLPREGKVQRSSERGYRRALNWMERHVSFAASDPKVHAVIHRTPGQRRTALASEARGAQGETRSEQIVRLWTALSNVPERSRASQIAKAMDLTSDHVRRVVRGKTQKSGHGMKLTSWSGPEFQQLRVQARAKIEAGQLPSAAAGLAYEQRTDTKHMCRCVVCDEGLSLEDLWWCRILDSSRSAPTPDRPAPELHIDCFAAWQIEVSEPESNPQR